MQLVYAKQHSHEPVCGQFDKASFLLILMHQI